MMMLSKYDITYTVQKSNKGNIVADFLADQPSEEIKDEEEMMFLDDDIMFVQDDIWKLMFDGASGRQGYRIGILLIDPFGVYNPTSIKLDYTIMNNEAEYKACITGVKLAYQKGIRKLEGHWRL